MFSAGVGVGSRSRVFKNAGVGVGSRSRFFKTAGVGVGSRSRFFKTAGVGVGILKNLPTPQPCFEGFVVCLKAGEGLFRLKADAHNHVNLTSMLDQVL